MEGMGLKFTTVVAKCLIGPLTMLGVWLALLVLIFGPKSPNQRFNPPPAAHAPTPPTLIPSTCPPPYICHL